ncbi:tryptophan-rich sensory protein [bacterium]|nr:tryptophan-rich sensory protein [bacterium]
MFDTIWYNSLNRPPLAPASYVFAPAWTMLYILMGISLLIYSLTKTDRKKRSGYLLFFAQLILNLIWTPIFFILKNIALALVAIIFLDISVFFNIKEFYKISRIAAILLVPYLIWILFATYLNAGYFALN